MAAALTYLFSAGTSVAGLAFIIRAIQRGARYRCFVFMAIVWVCGVIYFFLMALSALTISPSTVM